MINDDVSCVDDILRDVRSFVLLSLTLMTQVEK